MKSSRLKIILLNIFSIICAIVISFPAHANDRIPDESTLFFYGENNIFWYDPTGYVNGRSPDIICALTEDGSGSNTIYSGGQVLSESQLKAVEENKEFYQKAADQYGFPWQILATIHYMENSLRRSNPNSSGGGAYGATPDGHSGIYTKVGTLTPEEFQEQTDNAARVVQKIIETGNLDISSDDGIKTLFFHYNSGMYVDREHDPKGDWNRGYDMYGDVAAANRGEGSPYVMNQADGARDPFNPEEMSPYWLGQGDKYWSGRPGAYFVYGALGGTGLCAGLQSGGVDAAGAYQAMQQYISHVQENCATYIDSSACNIDGQLAPGANCVTYVKYFLAQYTSLGHISRLGNGKDVVNTLANSPYNLPTGNQPRPYAIFSTTNSNQFGHTGVVLGINEEAGEIYIGQMGLGYSLEWGTQQTTIVKQLSDFTNGNYIYAYTDNVLTI